MIPICPECGSSGIRKRSGKQSDDIEPGSYKCWLPEGCGEEFNEPDYRERDASRASGVGGLSSAGRRLVEMDPDELVTDGGRDEPRLPRIAGRLETTRDRLERTKAMLQRTGDDEELEEMVTDALACADAALARALGTDDTLQKARTDGGTVDRVSVGRQVLRELVAAAKGKLEGDVSTWGPEKTGYDVDRFAETIDEAEAALEEDQDDTVQKPDSGSPELAGDEGRMMGLVGNFCVDLDYVEAEDHVDDVEIELTNDSHGAMLSVARDAGVEGYVGVLAELPPEKARELADALNGIADLHEEEEPDP